MSVRYVTVKSDRAGQRLDNFLMTALGPAPRALIYRLIRKGQVRVNGSRARARQRLSTGDQVRLPPIRQEGEKSIPVPADLVTEIRRRIICETAELIVIDKPAGLAVHGGSGVHFGLTEVVRQWITDASPAHRLDRATSGLIVFGRTRTSLKALQQAFTLRQVEKRYLALLQGRFPEPLIRVDEPLLKVRDVGGQRRMVVDKQGDRAISQFRLLEQFAGFAFTEVTIETGRTHQIRAHARFLGLPLAGDELYNTEPAPTGLKRMFLHSHYLSLPAPCEQVLTSPLPTELRAFLDRL